MTTVLEVPTQHPLPVRGFEQLGDEENRTSTMQVAETTKNMMRRTAVQPTGKTDPKKKKKVTDSWTWSGKNLKKRKVLSRRFELRSLDSESKMLTNYTMRALILKLG